MKIYDLKKEFKTISQYENIFLQKGKKKLKKKFQRLEFLGDKVLGLILSSLLFDKYINFTEGMLSRTVSHLCSGRVLYKIAQDIRLDLYYKKKKNISEKKLADFLEVIIGAFYLNNGFDKTKKMIDKLWRPKLNNINHLKADNKTLLQEWSQSKKLGLPKIQYN